MVLTVPGDHNGALVASGFTLHRDRAGKSQSRRKKVVLMLKMLLEKRQHLSFSMEFLKRGSRVAGATNKGYF